MSDANGSGGFIRRAGKSASAAGESVEQLRERLAAEWGLITSCRRLFICLSEAGVELDDVSDALVLVASDLASPECRPEDVLLDLITARQETLHEINEPLAEANKERKAEGLDPLYLNPWLGVILEVGLHPYERIVLATTTYERWVEASSMIGEGRACEIIRLTFPDPPHHIVDLGRIPGYLVGRSRTPADKNPRHWVNKTPGVQRAPGVLHPFGF